MKFLLHTQIGIEKITEVELSDKFKKFYSLDYSGYVPHKNGIVQIDWRNEDKLDFYNELGSIEDAYFILDYVNNIPQLWTLKDIYRSLDKSKIKQNLDFFFDNLNDFGNSPEFRFVTRKKAANDFRRIDLEESIKDFFKNNISRAKVTSEEGVKEIWITLVKNRLIVAVRLTTKEVRQSYYKKALVSGTLRSSVAYSMAYLSDITSKDTIWDPFCGAGTIGCEISENFNFKKFICSDISNEAIEASKLNFSNLNSYKKNKSKISFRNEDFFDSKNYSDIIISNLPFGNKYEKNEAFIDDFFEKCTSIQNLKTITLLYTEIPQDFNWQLTRKFSVQVLGYPAYILVYKRNKFN